MEEPEDFVGLEATEVDERRFRESAGRVGAPGRLPMDADDRWETLALFIGG